MFGFIRKLLKLKKLDSLWNKRDITSPKWWNEFASTLLSIKEVNKFVRDTMDSLKGYKTYILAAVIAAATVAKYLGYIDENVYQTLIGLLGAGATATIAAKVNRVHLTAEQNQNTVKTLLGASLPQAAQTMRQEAGVTGGSYRGLRDPRARMILFAALLLPSLAYAQAPTATVVWSYDVNAAEVATYTQRVYVDGNQVTGNPTCTGATATLTNCQMPIGTLAAGAHTIAVEATKDNVTARTQISNLNIGTNAPRNPVNFRYQIQINVNLP